MSRSSAAAALLLAAALSPFTALAQEQPQQGQGQQPPTIFMTSWRCDRGALDDLVEEARQRELPILQALVDEGQLWSSSLMVHDWGDEWNYVTVMLADDMAAGLAANEEFGRRLEEQYGDDAAFLERCPTHRDNVYVGAFTTGETGVSPEPPYTVAMSAFACPFDEVDAIVEGAREQLVPAARASVDAGMGYWAGGMRHAWSDEWNYVVVRSARDVASLVAFADDIDERVEAAASEGATPGATPGTAACWAHKDNIYRLVLETTPRAE